VTRRTPLGDQRQLSLPACDVQRGPRVVFRLEPMLPTLTAPPFHRSGWVYEEKYDGYRIVAYKEGARVCLLSRQGRDWTEDFRDRRIARWSLTARS
jgi:ATP-dependent DNA ligase